MVLRAANDTARHLIARLLIFFLTFVPKNLIYKSHCDLVEVANFDVRENQSMKNATKKAAAKKTAKKPAKKGKK